MSAAPQVRRIRHLPHEALQARDLTHGVDRDERLRRLHTVALHGVWGVATGLGLAVDAGSVRVEPGVAYDATGRALVCPDPVTVPLPPLPVLPGAPSLWADLLLAAGGPSDDRPRWRWSIAGPARADVPTPTPARDVRPGIDVPLGRVVLVPGPPPTAVGSPDLEFRKVAHGLVRPRIAVDVLLAGTVPVRGYVGSWTVHVDTRVGGFSRAPAYAVVLGGDPLARYFPDGAGRDPGLVGPFLSVTRSDATGFDVTVWFAWPETDQAAPLQLLKSPMSVLPVPVQWTGVEP